jgi:DNA-binding transcriptional MocR family regulator
MNMPLSPVDLNKALPPTPAILDRALGDTLKTLSLSQGLGAQIRLNRTAGNREDRELGASWLSCRFQPPPSPDRIVVTNGTQSALALVLPFLAGPGELIVAEYLTYVVLAQIARRLGLRLEGVPVDDHGLVPEAFAQICRERKPKALYCNPTVQNPTATIMPESRRAVIADIARRHHVSIIEDDVIGALHGPTPRPIAAIAPDITWYCMTLSKCFAMGLRLAYVVAPSEAAAGDLVKPVQNLSSWFPSSLSLMVVGDWIKTGVGPKISAAIQDEMAERQSIATALLGHADYTTAAGALHIWLRLPRKFEPATFVQAAAQAGVTIRPSTVFLVDSSAAPNAVRISLSTPVHRAELETGLKRIATLIEQARG